MKKFIILMLFSSMAYGATAFLVKEEVIGGKKYCFYDHPTKGSKVVVQSEMSFCAFSIEI